MINVTKTYLPPFEEYTAILKRAWDKSWITNNGELVLELEAKIKAYLDVPHLLFAGNGTIVLQMALKALNITKEVITTPFSYVATTNAILWEGCTPVFVDIDPDTFCINASKIEAAITADTQAILATHVYGLPCDVEAIEFIAKKHGLKVIYDGAHAFGVMYKGKSLLSYGDISTCSFHATKLFHTVEGGCIICQNEEMAEKLQLYRSFGHKGNDYYSVGINGKNSEFHAAMGLAVWPKLSFIIAERKKLFNLYDSLLPVQLIHRYKEIKGLAYNFSYYPILLQNNASMQQVFTTLLKINVKARRYFYPSLNLLPQIKTTGEHCPISEDISTRILCLPVYPGLEETQVSVICSAISNVLQ